MRLFRIAISCGWLLVFGLGIVYLEAERVRIAHENLRRMKRVRDLEEILARTNAECALERERLLGGRRLLDALEESPASPGGLEP
ncbi:MAG: hypothetical protein JXP34_26175 [Planctomycetes bacterium]|nr:hypothetical protein [Planctomycetota bacterium]